MTNFFVLHPSQNNYFFSSLLPYTKCFAAEKSWACNHWSQPPEPSMRKEPAFHYFLWIPRVIWVDIGLYRKEIIMQEQKQQVQRSFSWLSKTSHDLFHPISKVHNVQKSYWSHPCITIWKVWDRPVGFLSQPCRKCEIDDMYFHHPPSSVIR